MPIQVARLRRWFALAAIAMVLIVAGTYFYARHRVRNVLREVPGKIGLDVQQTAQGFTVSRSEEGRTIFKVQASKAIQFKQGGRTELHEACAAATGLGSSIGLLQTRRSRLTRAMLCGVRNGAEATAGRGRRTRR